jgi:NitT/TauT family transport system substrate-binding protein
MPTSGRTARRRTLPALALAVVAAVTAACGGGAEPAAPASSAAAVPTQPASLVLDYTPNGTHSTYFVAKDKGFYAAHGIDLTIEPGRGSSVGLQALAAGQYTFAIAGAESVAGAIANGAQITAIASITSDAGLCAMVKPDSGITTLADLDGKTFATTPGGLVATLLPAMTAAAGLPAGAIENVSLGFDTYLSQFVTGQVDASQAFLYGEPIRVQARFDQATNCIPFTSVGLDLLGFTLVTTTKTATENPELVKSFLAATAEGVAAVKADPAGAITTLKAGLTPAQTQIMGTNEAEQKILETFLTLTPGETPETQGMGWGCFAPGAWDTELKTLQQYAGLSPSITTAQVYKDGLLPTPCGAGS